MKIKIIGTGIAGLMTAYHLVKSKSSDSKEVSIEIIEQQDEAHVQNATTHSLGWLNVHLTAPQTLVDAKGQMQDQQTFSHYDKYRVDSIKAWNALKPEFLKDGIKNLFSIDEPIVSVNGDKVTAVHLFFDANLESDFLKETKRFDNITPVGIGKGKALDKDKLAVTFPFVASLPSTVKLYNVSSEQLMNPCKLRDQLIAFLKSREVTFTFKKTVTYEMMEHEPKTQWIIAAGGGTNTLVNNTPLDTVDFSQESMAQVIYLKLKVPLDLKGIVFDFEATSDMPSFYLRNNEAGAFTLKIVLSRKSSDIKKTLDTIIKLLKIQVEATHYYDGTIVRPLTPDSRPLVQVGTNNVHLIYGHSLFSAGGTLFFDFVEQLKTVFNKAANVKAFNSKQLPAQNPIAEFMLQPGRFKNKMLGHPFGIFSKAYTIPLADPYVNPPLKKRFG